MTNVTIRYYHSLILSLMATVSLAGWVYADGKQGENWFNEIEKGPMLLWKENKADVAKVIPTKGREDKEGGILVDFQEPGIVVLTNRKNPTVLKSENRPRKFILRFWMKTETDYKTGDITDCFIRMQTPSCIGARVTFPRKKIAYLDNWTHVGQVFELAKDELIGSMQFRISSSRGGLKLWLDDLFFTEVTDLPEQKIKELLAGAEFKPKDEMPFREELVDRNKPIKGNHLRNTGFEAVANGDWAIPAHRMIETDFIQKNPHSGKQALKLPSGRLIHGPIELSMYKKHSLSAWVRPLDPSRPASVELRMDALNGGYRYEKKLIKLEPGWQRVIVTNILMPVPSRKYSFMIQGKNLVVDDIQIEEGEPSDYLPRGGLEASLSMNAKAFIYSWGENPEITIHLAAPDKATFKNQVTLRIFDAWEKIVFTKTIPVDLAQGEHITETISLPKTLRGAFRAEVLADGDILSRQVFSVLPTPRDIPAEQSMLGDHLNFNEFNLWAGRRMGTRWTRCHDGWTKIFKWYLIEPKLGQKQFDKPFGESVSPDEAVKLAKKYGIKILGVLDEPPGWAVGIPNRERCRGYYPENWKAWEQYVQSIVKRYADYIDTWELYNEPSHPKKYLELCQKTYPIFHDILPEGRLIGLSSSPGAPIIKKFVDLGGLKYLDDITTHIYSWSSNGNLGANYRIAQKEMQKDGKPMQNWMTEGNFKGSWGSFYPGNPRYEAEQRRDVRNIPRYLTVAKANGAKRVFYYWSNFPAPSPQDPVIGNGWSFYHHDTSITPGGAAWAVWAKMLDGTEPLLIIVDRDEEVYLFKDGEELVAVAWSETPRDITLPAGQFSKKASCTQIDAMGNEVELDLSKAHKYHMDNFIHYFRFRNATIPQVCTYFRKALKLPADWKVRKDGVMIREEEAVYDN